MRGTARYGVLVLALAAGGCRRDAADASRASSPPAVRQQGASAPASAAPRGVASRRVARPMAERREAQDLLDSAAALAASGHGPAAAPLLHRAAAFLIVQADIPRSGGTHELLVASDSLDAMAGRLSRGARLREGALARVSARANLAEAERHGVLAAAAWSTRSKESVADELLMAADHVERAGADAHLALSARMKRVLTEIRGLAATLSGDPGVDVQSLDEPLVELRLEVLAMRRALASPKP